MAFDPSVYTTTKVRALPVILLLDGSGSMAGEKIDTLNAAVNEMITSFKSGAQNEVAIQIAIITFSGGGANYAVPLSAVGDIAEVALRANGATPMGAALRMAKDLIEDKETISSKSYRPAVVLVSDGMPNDEWQDAMSGFIKSGRSSKCDRFAMAIGADADRGVLGMFLEGSENQVFEAADAGKIKDFFRFVTMSVSVRSKSKNPNQIAELPQGSALSPVPLSSLSSIDRRLQNETLKKKLLALELDDI